MSKFFSMNSKETMAKFNVTKDGLNEAQVLDALENYGPNQLNEKKKDGVLKVFLSQFKDLLVCILIAAGIISILSHNVESTIVIFAVITLNAILGTVQHFKAEQSLDSLKALSAPCAKVIRNGKKIEVQSKDVVPGDILVLEAGDLVTADGRIIENYSLQVNESSLTGESLSVEKNEFAIEKEEIALGDQKNMVFSGSLVTYGRALVVVTSTGMKTEIGKIATLMEETQEKKTPLQVTLDDFSTEHLSPGSVELLEWTIDFLNEQRDLFNETKDKTYWWQMIQLLPTSYNQKRTVHLNYETLGSMYHQRKHHKLDEWREFCEIIEDCLPYSEFITHKFE